jgi:hypothetical protein
MFRRARIFCGNFPAPNRYGNFCSYEVNDTDGAVRGVVTGSDDRKSCDRKSCDRKSCDRKSCDRKSCDRKSLAASFTNRSR